MVKETSFRDYGVSILKERLEKMLSYREAMLRGDDVETLHDMRVASRRLRAALTVFAPAFQSEDFRLLEAEVKNVTTALGEARDLDVMMEEMQRMKLKLPAEQQGGIGRLLAFKREQRERAQSQVIKALQHLEGAHLERRLGQIIGLNSELAEGKSEPNP